MEDELDAVSLKCMVVGDAAVGKTCMLISYSSNEFPKEYNPTVFDNYSANVIYNGKTVALGLWDTAGTDEYDQLRPLSYPDTHIFIAVFSIISQESLDNIGNKWVPEITANSESPFIVIGNKSDLRDDSSMKGRCVDSEQARKLAMKLGARRYIECSAKTQHNLKLVFDECIDVVHEVFEERKRLQRNKKDKKDCVIC